MLHTCAPDGADRGSVRRLRRDSRFFTIDIHCHYYYPGADTLLGEHKASNPRRSDLHSNDITKRINRERHKTELPKLTDISIRLAEMERLGIDMQVLSPSPGHYNYWAPAELARDSAVAVNDRLCALVAEHPDRFAAMATVPLQDGQMAAAELERAVKKLGFRGVEISTNVNGKELTRAGLEPFFAKAEELGAVVFIHPAGTSIADRMGDHYFRNIIGHPLELTIAIGQLVFDGYLERYSGLKVCVAHGGGYYAAYPGRFDHAFGCREDCRTHAAKPPRDYMRNVYFDSLVYTDHQLRALVEAWGVDHVLLGSDYPFDMGEPDPVGHVLSVASFSDEDRAAVLGRNAARLFGLKLPADRL